MNRTFILCVLLIISFKSHSEAICTFTAQENEYFEFTEYYPFKDKHFSSENVKNAKARLKAHESGKKVKYYIHDNTLNIIKGGKLQAEMFEAKKALEEYTPTNQGEWDRKEYNLKHKYLSLRKKYCDFQRSHYAIDW